MYVLGYTYLFSQIRRNWQNYSYLSFTQIKMHLYLSPLSYCSTTYSSSVLSYLYLPPPPPWFLFRLIYLYYYFSLISLLFIYLSPEKSISRFLIFLLHRQHKKPVRSPHKLSLPSTLSYITLFLFLSLSL